MLEYDEDVRRSNSKQAGGGGGGGVRMPLCWGATEITQLNECLGLGGVRRTALHGAFRGDGTDGSLVLFNVMRTHTAGGVGVLDIVLGWASFWCKGYTERRYPIYHSSGKETAMDVHNVWIQETTDTLHGVMR